ncbi:MAG: zinc-ribbon domain-containing protein [Candidatus Heimdallarchaeota archaeon]|nr:zinc-ribbon domain-containing protein [Candidatus Heimdallarchaeota archaeon]
MRYCQNCGLKVDNDSRFCSNCGSNVEMKKEQSPDQGIYSTTLDDDYVSYNEGTFPTKNNKKRKIIAGVIIGFVIIASLGIIVPITLLSLYGPLDYRYIGDINYSFESSTVEIIDLDLETFVGDIDITIDNYQLELVTATIRVYGRSDATLVNATNFVTSTIGNKEILTFQTENYSNFDTTARYYDIDILINPLVAIEYHIETFSGSIWLDLGDAYNCTINDINLYSFSGDIYAAFGIKSNIIADNLIFETSSGSINTYFESNTIINTTNIEFTTFSGDITTTFREQIVINCDTINLETSSGYGTLGFDLYNIVNVNHLRCKTFSGDFYFDFGYYAILSIPDIKMESSSGMIRLDAEDYQIACDVDWDIDTFSSDIIFNLNPDMSSHLNSTSIFAFDSSSGSIDISYGFNDLVIGLEVTATTTAGDIILPNAAEYYQSIGFDSKDIKYIFEIETFSGDIEVVESL